MEFELSKNQTAIIERVTQAASPFDGEYWRGIEETERFPEEFWAALRDSSLLGLPVASEYGGHGESILTTTIAAEYAARICGLPGAILFIVGPVFGSLLIDRHGTADQRDRYLPGLVNGEIWSGAFTEEASGANVTAIQTTADKVEDGYILRGSKKFIGLVEVAQHMVVLAKVPSYGQRVRRTDGLSLFVADLPAAGLHAERMGKMGCRYVDTNRVRLDDVQVSEDSVIGEPGRGWKLMFDVLNAERLMVAAGAIGAGMLAIKQAVAYANERKVWGAEESIGSYQGLQFPLAEAKTYLESARLKLYEAAWLLDRQDPGAGVASAMARYTAVKAGLYAVDRSIQTLGSVGYLTESGVERHWRDLRLHRLAPLSDEMALAYIAQHDLGLPRSYGLDS